MGTRGRPVRPPGGQGRGDYLRRVPRPQRERRVMEGSEGHGAGGLPVPLDGVPLRRRRLECPQHEPFTRRRTDAGAAAPRSEERRVGKECRSRWWADDVKKKRKEYEAVNTCH